MYDIQLPDPPLTDGKITLRPLEQADASALLACRRDEENIRWTYWLQGIDYSESDAREEIASTGLAGGYVRLAVIDARTGAFLGTCSLAVALDDCRSCEVGLTLMPDARGRGVGTGVVMALVRWAFAGLAMRRVQALIHPDNQVALALVARCGFVRGSLLRAHRPGGPGVGDRLLFWIESERSSAPRR